MADAGLCAPTFKSHRATPSHVNPTPCACRYDDTPRLLETVHEFERLRALRVEADVGLSTGGLDAAAAAAYLAQVVPLSPASFFQVSKFFPRTVGAFKFGKFGQNLGKPKIWEKPKN